MHAFEALYYLSFLNSTGAACKEKRKKKREGEEENKQSKRKDQGVGGQIRMTLGVRNDVD